MKKQILKILFLIILFQGFISVHAQKPTLVSDINTADPNSSSQPTGLTSIGDYMYFGASYALYSGGSRYYGLYKSDGTNSGTELVKDFGGNYYQGPDFFTELNGKIIFTVVNNANKVELWQTNGTTSGTLLIATLGDNTSFGVKRFIEINSKLLFVNQASATGIELWETDGTTAGTQLFIDINTGSNHSYPDNLTLYQNKVYFTAYSPNEGRELWLTDGTSSGTSMVTDFFSGTTGSNPRDLFVANNILYFVATPSTAVGEGVCISDGTSAGTSLLKNICTISGCQEIFQPNFCEYNGEVYFVAQNGTNGQELWKTDGTSSGTIMVQDIRVGSSSTLPSSLIVYKNFLYFIGGNGTGPVLYKTDGSSTGAVVVKSSIYANLIKMIDSTLYLSAYDPNFSSGYELYKSDGSTSGTILVKDIDPRNGQASNPNSFTNHKNKFYFVASSMFSGQELMTSDGTENGTKVVKDIYSTPQNSQPLALTPLGSKLIFTADDGINGREIWCTDSATNTTYLVKDINGSSNTSDPNFLKAMGGYVYFVANDGAGPQLWRTDGTNSGTTKITTIFSASGPGISSSSAIHQLTLMNGNLYFMGITSALGGELWKTDGTTSGTVLVKDIHTSQSGFPQQLTVVGNQLFFIADNGTTGKELWVSDGTTSGTNLVKDITSGTGTSTDFNAFANSFKAIGNTLCFRYGTSANGVEPWISDGTSAGTNMLKDINTGAASSNPNNFTLYKGSIYFAAFNASTGEELYITNGTTSGTSLLKDIFTGSSNSVPRSFIVFNDSMYFTANYNNNNNRELWVSDGTAAGTFLRAEINPSTSAGSDPLYFTKVGSNLYFTAMNIAIGEELWMLNSSNGKIAKVYDLIEGIETSNPNLLTPFAGSLYYTTRDLESGIELWKHQYILCDSSRPAKTGNGIAVSTNSNTLPNGTTCFCDDDKNLLLGLKLGGTGALIADNGVSVTIKSNPQFFNLGAGFNIADDYLWHTRTWNVNANTQPSSPVEVIFPFTKTEMEAFNPLLQANNYSDITNKNDLSFYKITNSAKNAHTPIDSLNTSDVEIITHGTSSDINKYIWHEIDANNWNAVFKVNGFSGGGAGIFPAGLVPLPVNNVLLKANWVNATTGKLNFTVIDEENEIQYFEIFKSTDGIKFEKISSIKSLFYNQKYTFTDMSLNKENDKTIYYYVNAITNSNKLIKSNIAELKAYTQAATIAAIPNPTTGKITIQTQEEIKKINLYTSMGKIYQIIKNDNNTILDISALENGIYHLEIETETGVRMIKIVKI